MKSLYEFLSLNFSLHSVNIAIQNLFDISMLVISTNEAKKRIVVKISVFVNCVNYKMIIL